jgi:hypothetical protein
MKTLGILLSNGIPFLAKKARLPFLLNNSPINEKRFSLILETDIGRFWAPPLIFFIKKQNSLRSDITFYFDGILSEVNFIVRSQTLIASCGSGIATAYITKRVFTDTIINFTYEFKNVFWLPELSDGIHFPGEL